ncbi:MAG: Asp-tRNA(Asn)/Glu-tRNA(Gln) amidotransferase subunit GatA [Calditrichaeota bacterium]|nr:Asp-tRNA(Asn)/Glu-tRNA(Gln) amidotransferase subunit GatA [Calditrichota bacterium]
MNYLTASFDTRQKALARNETSVVALVEAALESAKAKSHLNTFVTLTPELARRQAKRVDDEQMRGKLLPLAGVVLAVKDNIALEGVPLTCASKILAGYESLFTATALERLIDAGAVVIGKTNLDEFAMGSSTENSAFGPALNPCDEARVPGGSSGGSAVAVAAGIATAALGSETGGSVRQPAAFCGLLGLKPTYGRISRYGLVAFGSSLDQIGLFSQSSEEMTHIFEVMAGLDPRDNTSSDQPVPSASNGVIDPAGLRIGLPVEFSGEGVSPEVAREVEKTGQRLRSLGARVEPCSLPLTRYAIPVYYIIAPAEASSNLARYDGVRYGPRAEDNSSGDVIRLSRQAGFGPEVKRRIMLGTYVLSSGYYDAYYRKAQQVRRLIRDELLAAFDRFDLLLTPTTPTTAFKIGERISDPLAMYLSDIFTVTANLAGIPALSIPVGTDDRGLPVGVQLMAPPFREDLLIGSARLLETA